LHYLDFLEIILDDSTLWNEIEKELRDRKINGEIIVKGDNVMKGYYKNPEASESRIQKAPDGNLWFHTGDVATKDENGWFFFVDRKKDSIRRRGENIAAWSIERVINNHEKVLESAAYGIKGHQVGEDYAEDEVMVAVVLRPGESMTPEELLDFVQDKLAYFQIPRFIDFVEKLPKSEVHRIMKRFLKDRGVTETTYDREKSGYELKR